MPTGLTFRRTPGLVPEIEEREAAIFNGYTWRDWLGLPRHERTSGVAHHRLHQLIDLHRQEALQEDMTRQMRRRR